MPPTPLAAFLAFDFEADPRWRDAARSIDAPTTRAATLARAKWYRAHVDDGLDMGDVRRHLDGGAEAAAAPSAPPPPRQQPPSPARAPPPSTSPLASMPRQAMFTFSLNVIVVVASLCYTVGLTSWRRFALPAAVSALAAIARATGPPPSLTNLRSDPRPLLAWLATAASHDAAPELGFLWLAPPSLISVLPSTLAAATRAVEAALAGSPRHPRLTRARTLLVSSRARTLAGGAELATGVLLALSIFRGGGFVKPMAFFRTYLPARLRSPSGGGVASAAAAVAVGLAAALDRAGAAPAVAARARQTAAGWRQSD